MPDDNELDLGDTLPPEFIAQGGPSAIVEVKDPLRYISVMNQYEKTICDGQGPWGCEGYIGCPCDC